MKRKRQDGSKLPVKKMEKEMKKKMEMDSSPEGKRVYILLLVYSFSSRGRGRFLFLPSFFFFLLGIGLSVWLPSPPPTVKIAPLTDTFKRVTAHGMRHERKLETHSSETKEDGGHRGEMTSLVLSVRMFILGHSNWLISHFNGRQVTIWRRYAFVQVSMRSFERS